MDSDFDIVFSNACIQWVPDHKNLLRNLISLVKKDGVLAVQIPMNQNEPVHRIKTELMSSEKWNKYLFLANAPCSRPNAGVSSPLTSEKKTICTSSIPSNSEKPITEYLSPARILVPARTMMFPATDIR